MKIMSSLPRTTMFRPYHVSPAALWISLTMYAASACALLSFAGLAVSPKLTGPLLRVACCSLLLAAVTFCLLPLFERSSRRRARAATLPRSGS